MIDTLAVVGATVIVDKARVRAGQYAIQQLGYTVQDTKVREYKESIHSIKFK